MTTNLPEDEFPNQLSGVEDRVAEELRHRNNLWRSNYHEAAIFIEEGLNNDKFENHPRKRASLAAATVNGRDSNQATPLLPCVQQRTLAKSSKSSGLLGGQYTTIETYILVHNRYFYQLDLTASVVLLLLAIFEPPAVDGYQLNPTVHAAIELFALGIIAIELLLKFRWMGPRRFFHHGRTVIKLIVLLVMNIEAVVIFLRLTIHARYSRALRPIFLIDNHYCHGLRRAVRQIFQSLPPIIDMFTLVLFFMFVSSIFGFYFFASNNSYFSDMPSTVGNLLILATTANLPDIMMPSYGVSRWSAIFFVVFVIIHLFLFTNLTMAAVYEIFTRKEKEKFHKLLLHRRKACQEAFKLLVSRRQPKVIHYRQFMGLMRNLNRKCSIFDAYLIFKALDTDKNGSISLEEFYQIYDYINLEWRLVYPSIKWYDSCTFLPKRIRRILAFLKIIVEHKFFDATIDFLIATQAVLQFVEASAFDFHIPPIGFKAATNANDDVRPDSWSTLIFIVIFAFETMLRLLASGLGEYWRNRWNRFDFVVLTLSLAGLVCGFVGSTPFGWVIVLRILRLMRLFQFKRRYKDMWQTLTFIMLKRFVSMTCVVMILYYFFAIVGMELLGDYDLRNCCKNTSIESQFKYDNSSESAMYYLHDFGDLVSSYLTLFSMTSNTYWLTTMTAYAIVSGSNWTRIFFGIYYFCSIIVMNIVIAFILESFLFHIHYRNKMGDNCDDTNLFTVFVTLSSHEVEFLRENLGSYNCVKHLDEVESLMNQGEVCDLDHDSEEKTSLLKKNTNGYSNSNVDNNNSGSKTRRKLSKMELIDKSEKDFNRSSQSRASQCSSDKVYRRPWYLIYQAEQIRNKFSFTMKMYADEVEGWLAEAELADRDEISTMVSRNQIRAEHVAMARLVRRNIANNNGNPSLIVPRVRSYSTSAGLAGEHAANGDSSKDSL